jgi:hypothetical protein
MGESRRESEDFDGHLDVGGRAVLSYPVPRKRNEASIRVPRMFKSHVRPTIW